MRIHLGLLLLAAFLLGACSTSIPGAPDTAQNRPLPDAVVAMAATGQDLQSARLLPEDGCYWYLHNGPVEATENGGAKVGHGSGGMSLLRAA